MIVEDWIRKEIETLKAFGDWYNVQRSHRPSEFPNELSHGEWDEQYLFWAGGNARGRANELPKV